MAKQWLSEAAEVEVLQSGKPFFNELFKEIKGAKKEIHFHTYILNDDRFGKKIIKELINAAKRGVLVYVLADAFGSRTLSDEMVEQLRKHVHFRFFSPFLSFESISIGRRLHHKILITDSSRGLISGMNVADKYLSDENRIPWLDFAVKFRGPVCEELAVFCKRLWDKKMLIHRIADRPKTPQSIQVRITRNDWIRGKIEISRSYKNAIREAKKSIYLIGAYFYPYGSVKRALKNAAKRGVDVTILVSGVFDVPLLKDATLNLYKELNKAGVNIVEWDRSVMHGKGMIVDDEWLTLGSYNLNYLSDYRSIELNMEIADKKCIKKFRQLLKEEVEPYCKEVMISQDFSLLLYLRSYFSGLFLKVVHLFISNPFPFSKVKLF